MRTIDAESAAAYLRETGRVPEGRAVRVRELGGGVSNVVLRVEIEGQPPFVLKQSREQLRTRMEWFSRLDRIWTERDALQWLGTILPTGTVPTLRFDDPENYLFAMTCAPEGAEVWKTQLLAGQTDPAVARRAGTALGTIHGATVGHPSLAGRFADTTLFDQLRIDPYYRTIARVHPDLRPGVEDLITARDVGVPCLVLGDFSPKNILVHDTGLTLVDFETAHAGDPAFDLGFFLSHLLLKAFRAGPSHAAYLDLARTFLEAYTNASPPRNTTPDRLDDLSRRASRHTAACMLARIDGKSPVDYLDALNPDDVRHFAATILTADSPPDLVALIGFAAQEML